MWLSAGFQSRFKSSRGYRIVQTLQILLLGFVVPLFQQPRVKPRGGVASLK